MASKRSFLIGLIVLVAACAAQSDPIGDDRPWPPRPSWTPSFHLPLPETLAAFKLALKGPRDIVVFKNGTMVIVPLGLDDAEAKAAATSHLDDLIHGHVDMSVKRTAAWDVLVSYNRTGYEAGFNLVLQSVAKEHQDEIEARYLNGLVTDEVIVTPRGANGFDEEGKIALLGRTYMFLDALNPLVVQIDRASTN